MFSSLEWIHLIFVVTGSRLFMKSTAQCHEVLATEVEKIRHAENKGVAVVCNTYLLPGCALRAAADMAENLTAVLEINVAELALTPSCARSIYAKETSQLSELAPCFAGVLANLVTTPPVLWIVMKKHLTPISKTEYIMTPQELMDSAMLAKSPHTRTAVGIFSQMMGVPDADRLLHLSVPEWQAT